MTNEVLATAIGDIDKKIEVLERSMNYDKKIIKFKKQSGELKLSNYHKYSMTMWHDATVVLPNITGQSVGDITLELVKNDGVLNLSACQYGNMSPSDIPRKGVFNITFSWNHVLKAWCYVIVELKRIV